MSDMEHVNAVTRMQEYIEQHIKDDITLHDLAQAVGFSPWYCARLFKEYTGKGPFEYIRALRLSEAALLLRDEQKRVIDVAFEFVFGSHEGFTRAFQKTFGVAPKAYQKQAPPIPLFNPYPVRSYYIMQQDTSELPPLSDYFEVRIVGFPGRKMLLRRGKEADNYFAYIEEAGCDVWGILASVKEALYEPVGVWLPESLRPAGTSLYAQGIEVPDNYEGIVPEGFELMDLPACTMLMFQGEPFDEDRFDEAVMQLSASIDHYDPTPLGYVWADETVPRIQLEPQGYRGYIEARPVCTVQR